MAPAYLPAKESTAPYLGPNSVSPSSAQPWGRPLAARASPASRAPVAGRGTLKIGGAPSLGKTGAHQALVGKTVEGRNLRAQDHRPLRDVSTGRCGSDLDAPLDASGLDVSGP